jgi:hypothetical protein
MLLPADYVFNKNLPIQHLNFTLRIFTLDNNKTIIGRTFEKGNILYKVIENGNALQPLYSFPEPIVGIHIMRDNYILVSTDMDHWNPHTPCKIYLSRNNGKSFTHIKTLDQSGAIWWSMSSDRYNNIYIGEYGPKGVNQSKQVWKSSDLGKSWSVIFQAPNIEGIHIHLVAVDPFTQALWISYGDDKDGVLVSYDQGETWKFVSRSQPTSIVFSKDKIFFGEDMLYNGAVSVYDKTNKTYTRQIFKVNRFGNFAGPVYDMTMGAGNLLYVPFMKYPFLRHIPSLWVGNGSQWNLIMLCPDAQDRFEGFENIAGPDKFGYIYTSTYKIKDFSSLPLKNPDPLKPINKSVVSPKNITIRWKRVYGVDGYRLIIATDNEFKKRVLQADVREPFVTTTLHGNDRFYWKVKSLKKNMLTTSYSQTVWFVTSPMTGSNH